MLEIQLNMIASFTRACKSNSNCRRLSKVHRNVVFFLIVAHPGLLIVDHIHFQYNGLLLGKLSAPYL